MRIHDLYAAGAIAIQNGFPCGDWNEDGHGIVQLRPFNVTDGGQINLSTIKYIETEQKLDAYLLHPFDVIFNNTNSEELVGKTALWTKNDRAVLSNHMTIVRVLDAHATHPNFIALFLLYKWYDGHFKMVCRRHVNQASVSRERLCDLVFPPFGADEQRQIATVLSAVQRSIERQERLIALTAELKKALMHKLFTKGTRGEPLKQTEIGSVPKSWEVVPLGSLAKIGNGSTPKRDNVAFWEGGTIPWLTSGKIHESRIKAPDQYVTQTAKTECHLPLVPANSLLIAITGEGKTLGNTALVEFDTCVSQHLAYLNLQRADIVPSFLLYFLQSKYANLRQISVGTGSTKKALTCGLLKRYLAPIPQNNEQRLIANILDSTAAKIIAHQQVAANLRSLFRTLLHQLMTAQIRVHDLNLSALQESPAAGEPAGVA